MFPKNEDIYLNSIGIAVPHKDNIDEGNVNNKSLS